MPLSRTGLTSPFNHVTAHKKKPKRGVRKKWFSDRVRMVCHVVFLVALLASAIYFEVLWQEPRAPDKCDLAERHDFDVSASAYGKFMSMGFGELHSKNVTIVPLRGDTEPASVLNDVCEQRWYVAKLVQRLGEDRAKMIVIDKFFGPGSCSKCDPNTMSLVSEIQKSPIPVVVAVATQPSKLDPQHKCLILSPSLEFGQKSKTPKNSCDQLTENATGERSDKPPAAILSLSRLNEDPRKVPLSWYVYASDSATDNQEPSDRIHETLPYQAAILYDPGLLDEPRLKRMRDNGEHPFTGFIDPDSVSHIDALNYLCSGPDKAEMESRYSPLKCADHLKMNAKVADQIVIIGEDTPGRDRHDLFGKDVPGVYLQANYIESLLAHDYLRPVGAKWDIAMLVVWVALLYLLFWLLPPWLALLICVGLGACYWYGISQLVIREKLYPDVWVERLGAVALFLKFVDAQGHSLGELIKHSWSKRKALRPGE